MFRQSMFSQFSISLLQLLFKDKKEDSDDGFTLREFRTQVYLLACEGGGFSLARGQMSSEEKKQSVLRKASHLLVQSLVTWLPVGCQSFCYCLYLYLTKLLSELNLRMTLLC